MIRLPSDKLRQETQVAIHIGTRDLPRQLGAVGLVLGVCWHAGHQDGVLWLGGIIIATEVAARILSRLAPPSAADIGPGLIAAKLLLNVVGALAYLWPAVLLAGQPSVALLVAGLLWLFGVLVHITNTFQSLPLHNWTQIVPGMLLALHVFLVAQDTAHGPSPPVDWVITWVFVLVYGLNTVETIVQQKDTRAALDAARAQASERLRALERATRLDGLTGLLNRTAFDRALAELLERRRGGLRVAVFLIDLDDFKPINDTYSHAAGDAVLVELARRLSFFSLEGGIVARLGGDEFIVAMPAPATAEGVLALADRMLAEIEAPVHWGEKILRIGASIGIALTDAVTRAVPALCAAADQAMFRAKPERGPKAVVFDPAQFPPRPSLEDRRILSAALRSGAIRPHYQPKVRLDTATPIGFEALARWHHPERGLLSPADFLPQIDELGLQGEFLTVMTDAVLTDVTALLAEGLDPGQVSVNIPEVALATRSGRADLERLIAGAPAAARHLTFEITEDVFIARGGGPIQDGIAAFRRAGLRISLDDFGTGFASFQHLRQLEFDELKIDRSFVADLGTDPTAQLLVGAFLDIGRGFGVDVIAEGVETEAQRRCLLAMGCRFGQGYRFGKALPRDQMRDMLRQGGPGPAIDATADPPRLALGWD